MNDHVEKPIQCGGESITRDTSGCKSCLYDHLMSEKEVIENWLSKISIPKLVEEILLEEEMKRIFMYRAPKKNESVTRVANRTGF